MKRWMILGILLLVFLFGAVNRADAVSADDGFNPNANGGVWSTIAVQSDGKILVGGIFTSIGGAARNRIARLTNTDAAFQELSTDADGSTITWMRSGAGPEVHNVVFYGSSDIVVWTLLGSGTRITGGWELGGLSLPANANYYIKAEGKAYGGIYNASTSIMESIRNIYLSSPPAVTDWALY